MPADIKNATGIEYNGEFFTIDYIFKVAVAVKRKKRDALFWGLLEDWYSGRHGGMAGLFQIFVDFGVIPPGCIAYWVEEA